MNTKLYFYSQPTYLIRAAIEAKILFAVCLIKCGFWSDSVKTPPEKSPCSKKIGAVLVQQADRHSFEASAMFNFVFFIIMINKIEQSAKRKLLLNLLTDRTFENRPIKKVRPCTFFISEFCIRKTLKAKTTAIRGGERVYVELILRSDAVDAHRFKRDYTLRY